MMQKDLTYLSYEEKEALAKQEFLTNKAFEDKQDALHEDNIELAALNQEFLQAAFSMPSAPQGGGGGIVEIDSYTELLDLAKDDKLNPGTFYRFPYYAVAFDNSYRKAQFNGVMYDQKDFTPAIVKAGSPREYLTCQAVSTSTLSTTAYSDTFKNDELVIDHTQTQKGANMYEMQGYDITKVTYTPGVKYTEIILEAGQWFGGSGKTFASVFQQPNNYTVALYGDKQTLYVPYKVVDAATFKISVDVDLVKYFALATLASYWYVEIITISVFDEPIIKRRTNVVQNIATNFDYRNLYFPMPFRTDVNGAKLYGMNTRTATFFTSPYSIEMCRVFNNSIGYGELVETNLKNIRVESGNPFSWSDNCLRLEFPNGQATNVSIDNFGGQNSLRVTGNVKIGVLFSTICGPASFMGAIDIQSMYFCINFGELILLKIGSIISSTFEHRTNIRELSGTSFNECIFSGSISYATFSMAVEFTTLKNLVYLNVSRQILNQNLSGISSKDISFPAYVPPAVA